MRTNRLDTATPFPRMGKDPRKGRVVFRREDRLDEDCFRVYPSQSRVYSIGGAAGAAGAAGAPFRIPLGPCPC